MFVLCAFSCSLPFISVGAHMDGKGITFSDSVSATTGVPNSLVKVSAPVTHSYTVPFPSLPADIQKLKSYFAGKSASGTSHDGTALALSDTGDAGVDIVWEDFAVADGCSVN